MRAVLGIDAAWTMHNGSGVALVVEDTAGGWQCRALAPTYADYLGLANMPMQDFETLPAALVEASGKLGAGAELELIIADIPLARTPIIGRRSADDAVSRAFGGRGCGTHSPSSERPGAVSAKLRDGFASCGYPLVTLGPTVRGLVETYPHPALLPLMQANYRVPYKVGRAWRGVPASERWSRLVEQFQAIVAKLSCHIAGISLEWPVERVSVATLKAIEDQIDALVCAWVGIEMLAGRALPRGDENAAIWLPTEVRA